MARLFVIGDSHAMYCFAAIKEACIHNVGPVTMHRVGRDGIESLWPLAAKLEDGAVVIFSFGEIDCRAHVQRIVERTGSTYQHVIDDLVSRYVGTLGHFKRRHTVHVATSSVLPPIRSSFFTPGELAKQISFRHYINKRLAMASLEAGLQFVAFADQVSATDGTLQGGLSEDAVHFKPQHGRPILDAVSKSTGLRLTFRRVWGDARRYDTIPPLRKLRKLFTDPIRRVMRRFLWSRGANITFDID